MKKSYTRREFLGLSAAAVAAFSLTPLVFDACAKDKNTVNFFNWSRYIAKDTLPNFTKETGIAVDYDEFSDENAMFTKLRSGARDYDVVMVSDFLLPSFKALGLIDPIPQSFIPNIKNISPLFRNPPYDPGNAFSLPYLWGSTGIGFNRSKVVPPPHSWRALWDVKYSGKISMLDNSQDCIATALLTLNVFPSKIALNFRRFCTEGGG